MTLTPRQVDALLAGRDRDAARAAAQAATVVDADEWQADEYAAWAATHASAPAPAGERPQAGQVWRTAAGQVVRVVRSRQSGNLYGMAWDDGDWQYARGARSGDGPERGPDGHTRTIRRSLG